jgi:hypothetical protein
MAKRVYGSLDDDEYDALSILKAPGASKCDRTPLNQKISDRTPTYSAKRSFLAATQARDRAPQSLKSPNAIAKSTNVGLKSTK